MCYRRPVYYSALMAFMLCISASIWISASVKAQEYLNILGMNVMLQYSLASLLMLLIWWSAPHQATLQSYKALLIVAVIVRVLLLLTEPYTSNDVTRYLFDGRIALAGLDPYQISHDAPVLASLREQWNPPAEHAKYTTLYPPLAMALFTLASTAGPVGALWVWKLMTLLASLAVLWLGCLVLKRANALQHLPLLALSPLLIFEAGEGLHLDIFPALAVLAAIYYWQRQFLWGVGICLAIGALLKMLPMVLLLPMVIVLKTWSQRFILVLSAILTWGVGYLLFFSMGFRPVGSLSVFFEKWRSGSPLFLWLEPYFSGHTMLLLVVALWLVSMLILTIIVFCQQRKLPRADNSSTNNQSPQVYLAMQCMLIAPLMLTPVIFPWYLLPLIVLIALKPNAFLLVWTLTIPLLYEVLSQFACCQHWAPADWPIHVIGVGWLLALLFDIAIYYWRQHATQRFSNLFNS